MVAQRRKELVQQIAVRGVDLEEFESRRQGAARGSLESRDDGIDAYAGRPIRGDESASCVPPRQDGHRDVYRLPSIQDRLATMSGASRSSLRTLLHFAPTERVIDPQTKHGPFGPAQTTNYVLSLLLLLFPPWFELSHVTN
jgi:hypothetical protein